jgi:hypothetical protein
MYFYILELVLLFQSTERLCRFIQKTAHIDNIDICEILLGFNLPLWVIEYKLKDIPFDWEDVRFRAWFAKNYINKQQNQLIDNHNHSWVSTIPDPDKVVDILTDIFLPLEPGFAEREFTIAIYDEFKLFGTIVGDITIPRLVLETIYIYSNMWRKNYIDYLESKIKEYSFRVNPCSAEQFILKYTKILDDAGLTYTHPRDFELEFTITDLFSRLQYLWDNCQKQNVLEDKSQIEQSIREFTITFR